MSSIPYQRVQGTGTNGVIPTYPILAPAGTVGAPSIAIGTATNGFYAPAANQVALATNGTQAWLVDASQKSTFAGAMQVNGTQGLYLKGSSGQSGIADANVPLQISTGAANSEAYLGANKNGGYGFLLGYSNTSAAGWPLGGLMRMITTDPFTFVMGNGGGNTNALGFTSDGNTHFYAGNANLSTFDIKSVSQLTTLSGASTTVATIPAGAMVQMVTARVTTAITSGTATSWSLGTGALATDWGTGLAFTLGTTVKGSDYVTFTTPQMYPTSTAIVAVPNTGTFSGGAVRVTVYYSSVTPPTT